MPCRSRELLARSSGCVTRLSPSSRGRIHQGREKPQGLCSRLAQSRRWGSALLWAEQPGKHCFSRIAFLQTANPTDFFLAPTEAFLQRLLCSVRFRERLKGCSRFQESRRAQVVPSRDNAPRALPAPHPGAPGEALSWPQPRLGGDRRGGPARGRG